MADVAQAGWRPHPWAAEGQRRLRFGIFGGPLDDWPALVDWVQTAEALGFDSFWLPDHPVFAPDCWTMMAALAGVTTRIRLGPLVACAGYRHPLLLARQAADVDRLSGGRLALGLGIGDYAVELEQLGAALDLPARQRVLDETIRAVYGRWGAAPFPTQARDGEDATARLPYGPVQQPHVPLLIAGGGERVTLRQVARYADAANFGPSNVTGAAWSADDIRRKLDALRGHCEALGRPYESVLRTHVHPGGGVQIRAAGPLIHDRVRRENVDFEHARFIGTPGDAIVHFRALAEAGLQYFIVGLGRDAESLRLLGEEVIPAVTAG